MVLLMDYLDEIFQPLAESCGHVLAEVVTAAVGKERRAGWRRVLKVEWMFGGR